MSEWKEVSLSEMGKTITGKTPSSQYPEDFGDEIPFITPSDSFEKKYINKSERFLSRSGSDRLKEKIISPNSIMVTCIGSAMGKVVKNTLPSVTNQQINSIIVNESFDSDYIYYLLKNNYAVLRNAASGSTAIPILNKTDFDNLRFKVELDLNEQRKMVSILSTIDDKIETNHQINQELESMAKILYDYWFVQFDFPDQNGKPYKSSGGKMVYHPELKREIPEGWGVSKIEDIAKTGSGGTPKSTNVSYYSNGEIPWINSGELEQTVIISTSNFITEEGLNNSSAKLFPSGTILVAMYGATAGKVSFLTFEASTNQAICAIMLKDIRMRYYLKNVIEDLYQYLVKLSTGSARDNLSQDMIKNIKVVIPSNDILDRYYDFSNNIIKEITKKQQENEKLTQLRDWLLPMLMNGQVKVER